MDASGQTLIGQMKKDISIEKILMVLGTNESPFDRGRRSFLMSIREDHDGSDTIYAEGFDPRTDRGAIQDTLFPNEGPCDDIFEYSKSCATKSAFQKGLSKMKAGEAGRLEVVTQAVDRMGDDAYHITYQPVTVTVMKPIDAANFSRGVEPIETTVYTMGFIQPNDSLQQAFLILRGNLDRSAQIALLVLVAIIVVSCILLLYVSAQMTISITVPVTQLLRHVERINKLEGLDDDFPEIRGGSAEVRQVRRTFERLFLFIRFATSAFFSGEIHRAHTMLTEAHDLFRKLGNDKAVGIANNNLGNTMLTMYRTMKKTGAPTIGNMTKDIVIRKGESYFRQAIDTGEVALERINQEEGFGVNYLVFMQQLSNRYFNRAMFLLSVRDDHPNPEEAERQGMMDLSTAKNMDREVVDNGDTEGFKGEQDIHFELLLSRIKGLLILVRMGYEDEWDLDELFQEAQTELCVALRQPGHTLFRDMEPAGQMQRLEYSWVEYHRLLSDKRQAAKMAIRMLVEDDFIIGEAAMLAIRAILDNLDETKTETAQLKAELFRYRHRVGEAIALQQSQNDTLAREAFLLSNTGDVSMEGF